MLSRQEKETAAWLVKIVLVIGFVGLGAWLISTRDEASIWPAIGIAFTASGLFSLVSLIHEIVKITLLSDQRLWSGPLQQNKVLRDPEFWLDIFNAISVPVYLKEYKVGAARHEHVIHNNALAMFEERESGAPAVAVAQTIQQDHRRGDDKAYEQSSSTQLELGARGRPGVNEMPIISEKIRIKRGNMSYIVGTLRALAPLSSRPQEECFGIPYVAGQILLVLPPETGSNVLASRSIDVGQAIRDDTD